MADHHRNRSRSRSNQGRYHDKHVFNVPKQNRYSTLNNNVNEHEVIRFDSKKGKANEPKNSGKSDNSNNNNGNVSDLKQRIPPIKVTNRKISEIRSAIMSIDNIKVVQNMFHPTQYGNYIYAQSVSDYKVIREFCDNNEFKYITHPLNDEIIERFCLYGLEPMDHDELKSELTKFEVKPVQITEIPIRNKRFAEHCIYVLHFMRKQKIHLHALQQITGMFNTRVRFAVYDDPNKFEPKQCKRCQNYNHGERGCTQDYKCRRCAGAHPTRDCKHLPEIEVENEDTEGMSDTDGVKTLIKVRDVKARIDDKHLKCANCGGNHTANYKGCAKRMEIVQLRDEIHNRRLMSQRTAPNFQDQTQFGPLPPLGRPIGMNSWQQTDSRPSYAHPPRNEQKRGQYEHQEQYHHHDQYHRSSQGTDLFTAEECFDIMEEFTSRLSACRNKSDQFRVISDMSFKYIYSRNAYTK